MSAADIADVPAALASAAALGPLLRALRDPRATAEQRQRAGDPLAGALAVELAGVDVATAEACLFDDTTAIALAYFVRASVYGALTRYVRDAGDPIAALRRSAATAQRDRLTEIADRLGLIEVPREDGGE